MTDIVTRLLLKDLFMPSQRFPNLTITAALRPLMVGAAALVVLSAPAAAADTGCQTLMRSFDRVVAEGGTAAKVAEAKKSRKAGAAALANGDEQACLKHLEQAQSSISQAQRSMAIEEPDIAQ
jgi:hypothetical protein